MKTLTNHSRLFLPQKEIHFFNRETITLKEYREMFQEGKINGEKTPGYVRSKKAMERIHALVPEVRLIVTLRYPVQAVHSFYEQRVRSFYLNKVHSINPADISFTDIILGDLDIRAVSMANYNYIHLLKNNVLRIFQREQLKIIIQEDMQNDPEKMLRDIFEFLGVEFEQLNIMNNKSYDSDYRYQHINYDTPEYGSALRKIMHYYRPTIDELYQFLGRKIEDWESLEKKYRGMI